MIRLIDSHCHLDAFPNPLQVVNHVPDTEIIAVTELPSRFRLLKTRFKNQPRVHVALGLHPLAAHQAGPLEVGMLTRLLQSTHYIGEVGLDFSSHGKSTANEQVSVLQILLEQPDLKHKIVTVHSRGAAKEVISMFGAAGIRPILHWYTGPSGLLDNALSAGMYFSINPAMLRSPKGRSIASAIPKDRVLTESDGPYVRIGNRAAEPGDMRDVAAFLGRIWGESMAEASARILANLRELERSCHFEGGANIRIDGSL